MAELYDRYLPYVWRYVHNRLPGNPEAGQDVVGETFLAAIRGVGGFSEHMGSIAAWLTGIARHKLADVYRERRPPVSHLAVSRRCQAAGADPPTAAGDAETRQRVVRAMHQLADEDRLLLEWKYLEDLSVREIAARWGRTEKAIEAQLYRARRSFRQFWSTHNDRLGRRADR